MLFTHFLTAYPLCIEGETLKKGQPSLLREVAHVFSSRGLDFQLEKIFLTTRYFLPYLRKSGTDFMKTLVDIY